MRTTLILLPILLLTSALAQDEAAAEAGSAPAKQLTENQKAFLNMPEERRNDFVKALGEATRLFQQKRIFETMEKLDEASKIFDQSPEVMNLRGSCFVEIRAFDKALAEFEDAAKLSNDNPSIEFNIAEVYFVTKEWKKALDLFEKVLTKVPEQNAALSRLVEFKVMLCKNKLGMKEDVDALADKYDYLDDSPYYYYAQAALAYENDDLVKAEEWLAMARRIFQDPAILAPWQDTLVEYGYIKSFYGGDLGTDEE
ncbi:MAG: hypothetical protein H7A49_08805 [Akkermansiaceae bacterium]|nr:hypothetical protein [Akkermansiaceae bacterium]MCP5543992.1 hypothetical protein [Akkermansiaceae bacterium]